MKLINDEILTDVIGGRLELTGYFISNKPGQSTVPEPLGKGHNKAYSPEQIEKIIASRPWRFSYAGGHYPN